MGGPTVLVEVLDEVRLGLQLELDLGRQHGGQGALLALRDWVALHIEYLRRIITIRRRDLLKDMRAAKDIEIIREIDCGKTAINN